MSDLTIAAVGDILIPPDPLDFRIERLAKVVKPLRDADLGLANMESPLVDSGLPIQKIDIARADRAKAKEIARMGIDVVTLANNHTLDYGLHGLKSTKRALKRSGIQFAGVGQDARAAFRHLLLEKNGLKIAFLGAHAYFHSTWDHYPDEYRADAHKPGAAVIQGYEVRVPRSEDLLDSSSIIAPAERFLQYLVNAVKKAREEADIVILALHSHWGTDDGHRVDLGRRIICHEAVNAGADLIFGHGPHVFNGVEVYKGVFIAHSLGNFFFHMPAGLGELVPEVRPFVSQMSKEERFWEGLILQADFKNGARPSEVRFHPCHLSHEQDGTPHLAGGKVKERILQRLQEKSRLLGTEISQEDGVFVARPAP